LVERQKGSQDTGCTQFAVASEDVHRALVSAVSNGHLPPSAAKLTQYLDGAGLPPGQTNPYYTVRQLEPVGYGVAEVLW